MIVMITWWRKFEKNIENTFEYFEELSRLKEKKIF